MQQQHHNASFLLTPAASAASTPASSLPSFLGAVWKRFVAHSSLPPSSASPAAPLGSSLSASAHKKGRGASDQCCCESDSETCSREGTHDGTSTSTSTSTSGQSHSSPHGRQSKQQTETPLSHTLNASPEATPAVNVPHPQPEPLIASSEPAPAMASSTSPAPVHLNLSLKHRSHFKQRSAPLLPFTTTSDTSSTRPRHAAHPLPAPSSAPTTLATRLPSLITLPILVFLICTATKLIAISSPAEVVFDEVHVGGFVNDYLKGTYFFDLHPPLGKLLYTLVARLHGYAGDFDFSKIGLPYASAIPALEPGPAGDCSSPPFVAMRSVAAVAGSLVSVAAYLTLRELDHSSVCAVAAALLLNFDNALHVQSRLILLDSPLLCAIAWSVYFWVRHSRMGIAESFTRRWWVSLVMCGVALACTMSIKWVGLGVVAVVGIDTVVLLLRMTEYTATDAEESYYFAKHATGAPPQQSRPQSSSAQSPPPPSANAVVSFSLVASDAQSASALSSRAGILFSQDEFSRQFWARALCLALVPLAIYTCLFYAHFALLPLSGPGDAFMSADFKEYVKFNSFSTAEPRILATFPDHESSLSSPSSAVGGSFLVLAAATNPLWLLQVSERVTSTAGSTESSSPSPTSSVALGYYTRFVDMWGLPLFQTLPSLPPSFQANLAAQDMHVKLRHQSTGLYLGLVLGSDGQSFHPAGVVDEQRLFTDWKFVTPGPGVAFEQSRASQSKLNIRSASHLVGPVLLENVATGCRLSVVDDMSEAWLQEGSTPIVACVKRGSSVPTQWMAFKPSQAAPPRPFFLALFLQLHITMWISNKNLVTSHPYASSPSAWPFLQRGVSYWMNDGRQMYFIGNPLVWWACSATMGFLALWALWRAIIASVSPLFQTVAKRLSPAWHLSSRCWSLMQACIPKSCMLFLVLWLIHYAPFFMFGRQLFLHHYLPALYFSVLAFASLLDVLINKVSVLMVWRDRRQYEPAALEQLLEHATTHASGGGGSGGELAYELDTLKSLATALANRVVWLRLVVLGLCVVCAFACFVFFLPVTSGGALAGDLELLARQWRRGWNFQYI